GEHHRVAGAGAYETQAALTVMQLAKAWADVALQAAIRERVPVPGGIEGAVDHSVHTVSPRLALCWILDPEARSGCGPSACGGGHLLPGRMWRAGTPARAVLV